MTEEDRAPTDSATFPKSCFVCGKIGGEDSFYRATPRSFDSYCKDCRKKQAKKSKQDRVESDPQGYKAMWRRIRLAKYGLTEEDYDSMLSAQGRVCASCGEPETYRFKGSVVPLAVDHDHDCCSAQNRSCGQCVRGLLCRRCNMAIGMAKNSPAMLRQMAMYLDRSESGGHCVSGHPLAKAAGGRGELTPTGLPPFGAGD